MLKLVTRPKTQMNQEMHSKMKKMRNNKIHTFCFLSQGSILNQSRFRAILIPKYPNPSPQFILCFLSKPLKHYN